MSYWQTAYRSHAPAVLAYLSRRVGRRQDAEDLLQETFVRAIRTIRSGDGLRDERKLRPYLMTIAHNLLINDSRRKQLVQLPEGAEEESPNGRLVPVVCEPEASLAYRELRERLVALLAEMKPQFRQAFELAIVGGLSYREVAKQTGWSLPQVKINVYRARRQVIAGLQDLLPHAEGGSQ